MNASRHRFLSRLAIVLLVLGLAGCSVVQPDLPLPKADAVVGADELLSGLKEEWLWNVIDGADVIYVSERHDDDRHHRYQLALLKEMRARGIPFAVGWEMIEVDQQQSLDLLLSGEKEAATLLEEVRWEENWSRSSRFYERILRWAAAEEIENVGLSVSRSLTSSVAKGKPLTAAEKRKLPRGFPMPPGGLRHFARQMDGHPGVTRATIEDYYRAQLVREQTIAASILAFQARRPGVKLVVLLGRGHSSTKYGVPWFVRQKSQLRQFILHPWPVDEDELDDPQQPKARGYRV